MSVRLLRSTSLLLGLSLAFGALAADDSANDASLRPSYKQCIDASGGVTPEIQDCIEAEFEHQADRLNVAYAALMQSLDEAAQTELRQAQQVWAEQHERECAPEPGPGQAQRLISNDCSLQMTARRASELEARLAP